MHRKINKMVHWWLKALIRLYTPLSLSDDPATRKLYSLARSQDSQLDCYEIFTYLTEKAPHVIPQLPPCKPGEWISTDFHEVKRPDSVRIKRWSKHILREFDPSYPWVQSNSWCFFSLEPNQKLRSTIMNSGGADLYLRFSFGLFNLSLHIFGVTALQHNSKHVFSLPYKLLSCASILIWCIFIFLIPT